MDLNTAAELQDRLLVATTIQKSQETWAAYTELLADQKMVLRFSSVVWQPSQNP